MPKSSTRYNEELYEVTPDLRPRPSASPSRPRVAQRALAPAVKRQPGLRVCESALADSSSLESRPGHREPKQRSCKD
eukprot:5759511-Pyramimonas_sp.AAC.1